PSRLRGSSLCSRKSASRASGTGRGATASGALWRCKVGARARPKMVTPRHQLVVGTLGGLATRDRRAGAARNGGNTAHPAGPFGTLTLHSRREEAVWWYSYGRSSTGSSA